MNIKETSQPNYFQLQAVLGSPSYYYKDGVRVPAPPLAHALPAYSQQYLNDNLAILLPDFVTNLRFRQPPGAINDLMPADYEPTDQLYDQDMDYNIAPRKTKNGDRLFGGIFKWVDDFYHQYLEGKR